MTGPGFIRRRVGILAGDIASQAVTEAKIASQAVTEAKMYEHYEHGTITGITATGRYRAFTTAFGAAPAVNVTAVAKIAYLGVAPATGSFNVKLSAAGTANGYFIAFGQKA